MIIYFYGTVLTIIVLYYINTMLFAAVFFDYNITFFLLKWCLFVCNFFVLVMGCLPLILPIVFFFVYQAYSIRCQFILPDGLLCILCYCVCLV